jgi:hypothetical protein
MVIWDVMLCTFLDSYQEEPGASKFMITSSAIKAEIWGSSDLLVPIYQTVCHLTPEDCNSEQFVNLRTVSQLCLHSTDANFNFNFNFISITKIHIRELIHVQWNLSSQTPLITNKSVSKQIFWKKSLGWRTVSRVTNMQAGNNSWQQAGSFDRTASVAV